MHPGIFMGPVLRDQKRTTQQHTTLRSCYLVLGNQSYQFCNLQLLPHVPLIRSGHPTPPTNFLCNQLRGSTFWNILSKAFRALTKLQGNKTKAICIGKDMLIITNEMTYTTSVEKKNILVDPSWNCRTAVHSSYTYRVLETTSQHKLAWGHL